MSRIAIIITDQYDFAANWARLLRNRGDEVTIILAHLSKTDFQVDPVWKATLASAGIDLICLVTEPVPPLRYPQIPAHLMSERIETLIKGFEIVYFQDRANLAFSTLRSKRLQAVRAPACITVLIGPTSWERLARQTYQLDAADPCHEYIESYCARNSDYVLSPSRYMMDWVIQHGWQLPPPERRRILGLPLVLCANPMPAGSIRKRRRIVCWPAKDRSHGMDRFLAAMNLVAMEQTGSGLEVLVLGPECLYHQSRFARPFEQIQRRGFTVEYGEHFNIEEIQMLLQSSATGTLVVIPEPLDHFPYRACLALSIPGIDVLIPDSGGFPEIVSQSYSSHLYTPTPRVLADCIRSWIRRKYPPEGETRRYDHEEANRKWLEFHDEVLHTVRSAVTTVSTFHEPGTGPAKPAVDVCIPHFNKGKYFPQLLFALERQTSKEFTVIAVDDGSTEPKSRRVFEQMAAKYASRGWTFIHQENSFADIARNNAAKHGKSEFIAFIDADDIPSLNWIERLLSALRQTGDDCVTTPNYLFKGQGFPYDLETGKPTYPPSFLYSPLGCSPLTAMADPNVLGGIGLCVRRSAFESLGGFKSLYGATHEDYELHIRLGLAGYQSDIIPEYLYFYRIVEDGVAQNIDSFMSTYRLIQIYDDALSSIGLSGAASRMIWMRHRIMQLERALIASAPACTPPVSAWDILDEAGLGPIQPEQILTSTEQSSPRKEGAGPFLILRRLYHAAIGMPTRIRIRNIRARWIGR